MKQQFPCGHKGKGQYCHRCKQADACANNIDGANEAQRLRATDKQPVAAAPQKRRCLHIFKDDYCVLCDEPSYRQRAYMEAVEEKMTRSSEWREPGESDWREAAFGDIRDRGHHH